MRPLKKKGMEGGVKLDRWGYQVNTSSDDCIASINSYYLQVLSYGRERRVILEATLHDKDCVLANILAAHFLSAHPSRASPYIQAAQSRLDQATSYEKAVFHAVSYLMSEGRDDDVAFDLHDKLLREYPKDLASLKRAQILCFYMGRADLSLKLIEQVLPQNEGGDYVYGMLAFPLLELGRMADAEQAARKGLEINKQDYWYQCRFKEAVRFMEECSVSWTSCSSFIRILEVYDHHIWKELERDDATPVEVYLNALGLLLRVYVRDELDTFEDRLQVLASRLTDQDNWFVDWHIDILILWALAKAGLTSKAEELLEGLKSRLASASKKKQQIMHRGILLAEALYEYGRGNEKRAVELLGPDFDAYDCKMIGASDEQVDVFNEVWYCMLLNTGQARDAVEVMEKRIKKREGSPFMWRLLEKGYVKTGRLEEAKVAAEKASALESSHFV
ncbi:hypothetical protein Tsubulata_035098 [Turnera subulata]|uniref:Tetratricopeptide repeat protein 38 n=1 Tax=Turnera subulata TaxID=218843 RepID=A0A9Q0FDW8_9ROSI|nr:hypothetical protein Tsubulata_035098 [Turnera subulata]